MSEICLIHLVWKPLGIQPFRDFIASYKRNPAGVSHRFVIVFNGFDSAAELDEYHDTLAGLAHEYFMVSAPAQDLPVYFWAAKTFVDTFFCFLNSYSVILHEAWLAKLRTHLTGSVGLVGATGSCESFFSSFGLGRNHVTSWRQLRNLISNDQEYRTYAHFPPFPNYHIRTNSFMIARELMLRIKVRRLHTKMDCLKLESGKNSITRQIMSVGLKPLVVGRDGISYEKEEWFESGTFRSGGQHNLLVADNQTRLYSEADWPVRSMIEQIQWRSWQRKGRAVT